MSSRSIRSKPWTPRPRGVARAALCVSMTFACGGAPRVSPESEATASSDKASTVRVAQKAIGLASGDSHSCAVVVGGAVFCWGRNREGELGDGGAAGTAPRPIAVPNLRDVEEVAAGHAFSCARLKGGKVRCWGSGKILGDGKNVEKVRPTDVVGIDGAVELKAGGYVACARTATGAVRCWGTESIRSGAPSAGAEEIAVAGAHACARSLDGKVTCWGEGLSAPSRAKTMPAVDVAKASALSTGDTFVCAVVDAQPRCWGRNDQGELGVNPDKETRTKPIVVKNVTGVTKLSSAVARTCALDRTESVTCWGANQEGELGRGTRSASELAGKVDGLSGAAEVAVGGDHVCARKSDGTLYCWGSNVQGQVGDGTNERRTTPVRVVW